MKWVLRERCRTAGERSQELHLLPSRPASAAGEATTDGREHHRDATNVGCRITATFVSATGALPVVVTVPAVVVVTDPTTVVVTQSTKSRSS